MDKADDTRPVQGDQFSAAHDSKTTSKKSFVHGYLVHTKGSDIERVSNESAGKDIGCVVRHLRIEFSDGDLGHRAAYTTARICGSFKLGPWRSTAPLDTERPGSQSAVVKPGSSRRDFIRRALFGGAISGALSRAVSSFAQSASGTVDRRRLGRVGVDVSILGLGLGGAFMDAYETRLDAGHAMLESALAKGINYWDTARSYGPSESMIAPVLTRNRRRIFLASKSDSRDYDGFKRDLEESLRVLRTDYIDLYQLHDLRPSESASLSSIETGAVRAAREAREQKTIRAFGITGHSGAGMLIECIKRFDPNTVLTVFLATHPENGRFEQELLPLARSHQMGVIAMKTIRYGRSAGLSSGELLRYTLSLNGVHTTIVGLDTPAHLAANVAVTSGFKAMRNAKQDEFHQTVRGILAGSEPPWEAPGYVDGRVA